MLPAVACAFIATLTSWIYLPQHATSLDIPHFRFSVALMVWGLIAGPLLGVAAVLYIRLVALISHHHVQGRWAPAAPLLAFNRRGARRRPRSRLVQSVPGLAGGRLRDGGRRRDDRRRHAGPTGALALILEFTHAGFGVMVPMMAATALATIVARHLDGYTIYSARLSAEPPASAAPGPEARPAQARAG